MKKLTLKILCHVPLLMLYACQLPYQGHVDSTGYKHYQENKIAKKSHAFMITFSGKDLSSTTKQELASFVTQKPSPYRTSTHVIVSREIDEMKLATLKKFLKSKGLRFNQIHTSPTLVKGDKSSFEARIDHFELMPPNCPDWSQSIGLEDPTKAPSNYGCATAWNDYYSTEDPATLFGGYEALSNTKPATDQKK